VTVVCIMRMLALPLWFYGNSARQISTNRALNIMTHIMQINSRFKR
jgi:hypothetical protein